MNGLQLVALSAAFLTLTACGGDDDMNDEMGDMDHDVAVETMPEPAMPAAPATGALIDANTATDQQLVSAGLSAEAAAAVVAGQPYADVLALDGALSGVLDESARESAYRSVWIPINLNTASDEEILLIPGVGDRMLHEFKEYRPYDGIERFRREIGKYVDEAEVARFEQYVTLN